MDAFDLLLLWLILSGAVIPLARSRGRNWFGWLLAAIILSPAIAIIWLLCCENKTSGRRHQELLQAVGLRRWPPPTPPRPPPPAPMIVTPTWSHSILPPPQLVDY